MIDYYKNNLLFHKVDENHLDTLINYFGDIQSCAKGEYLMKQGSDDSTIFLLVSGKVRLSIVSENGGHLSYNDILPNDYFGFLSYINSGDRLSSALAQDDIKFYTIQVDEFEKILMSHPQIQKNFLLRLGDVIKRYTMRIEELTFSSVSERILLEINRLYIQRGNPIQIKSHEDMASWAGTTRETVSRTMSDLEKRRIITRIGANQYEFHNDQPSND